jgi:hypothetical protein
MISIVMNDYELRQKHSGITAVLLRPAAHRSLVPPSCKPGAILPSECPSPTVGRLAGIPVCAARENTEFNVAGQTRTPRRLATFGTSPLDVCRSGGHSRAHSQASAWGSELS